MLRAVIVALVAFVVPAVAAEPEVVRIVTSDKWELAADYWAGQPDAPGVILLHQYRSDRSSWGPLVPALTAKGFHVLALDQRAHGASTRKSLQTVEVGSLAREAFAELVRQGPHDVAAARAFLSERGADPRRTALVGASYGCSVSLLSSEALDDVAALVLFSPGTNYFGVDVVAATRKLRCPTWIFAADDDRSASQNARTLSEAAPPQAGCQAQTFATGGHGTALLGSQATTIEATAAFLAEALAAKQPQTPTPKPQEGPSSQPTSKPTAGGGR